MEQTTGRHNCDSPSSGNRRVINEVYPTRPSETLFQIRTFKPPNPSFNPHSFTTPPISLFLKLPQYLLYQPPIISPHNSLKP